MAKSLASLVWASGLQAHPQTILAGPNCRAEPTARESLQQQLLTLAHASLYFGKPTCTGHAPNPHYENNNEGPASLYTSR